MKKVNELSSKFSEIIRSWLTEKELKEVIRKNKTAEYINADAAHDYCDANEAMLEAYVFIYGDAANLFSDEATDLINAAWALSKEKEFQN